MKNLHLYIIVGMTILIVVLCYFLYSMNSDIKIYKHEIELSKLSSEKGLIKNKTDSVIDEILKKSTETVKKSYKLIKSIQHESPKIKDTTDNYMLQYISNFRPKTD